MVICVKHNIYIIKFVGMVDWVSRLENVLLKAIRDVFI
jgi:hypothetical protein